jgi:cyclopropane-fatty-acyl-phospholipid synthase
MKALAQKILRELSEQFPDTLFHARFWTGESEQYGLGAPRFTLTLKTEAAARRILRDGSLGFGEAYMASDIEVDGSLQDLLKFHTRFAYSRLSWRERLNYLWSVFVTRNTIGGAKRNVSRHYDLGNDFYRLWLDSNMTYTCVYFCDPNDTLDQAQRNKHEHICRKLRLQPNQTLVDIGCGWGALMFYAAEHYGVHCTGYTISEEQYDYVQTMIKQRGLAGRVRIFLKDYREAEGVFDRFVSVGMCEQVGKSFIPTYFDGVQRWLKPGGVGLLHTIGAVQSGPNDPWIEKYIFPGGYLPTLPELIEPLNARNLNVYDVEDWRLHYAQTLDHWIQRVAAQCDAIVRMYDETFIRMWMLYLNLSAAGFRYGTIRLYQLNFTNGLDNHMPRTRAYLYHPRSTTVLRGNAALCCACPLHRVSAFGHDQ